MIATIDGDAERSVRARAPLFQRPRPETSEAFSNPSLDGDATFARLSRNIVPTSIWVRGASGGYRNVEESALSIGEGTLCQVGVHLVPEAAHTSGRFCQIVSGELRGIRFVFKAGDFQTAETPSKAGRLSGRQHRRPKRAARVRSVA